MYQVLFGASSVFIAAVIVSKVFNNQQQQDQKTIMESKNNNINNNLMDVESNSISDFGPDINIEFGVTAKQGRRPYMEDRYIIIDDLSNVDTSLDNYEGIIS